MRQPVTKLLSPAGNTARARLYLAMLGIMLSFSVTAAGWTEAFEDAPTAHGWHVVGDPSLFTWDSVGQSLAVTWDSSRTNSYFLRSLGAVLSSTDDFSFSFDLRLDDVTVGLTTNKPYAFELAAGLVRLRNATNANLERGTGVNAGHGPRNLAEFDYFPAVGIVEATISPTLVSSNNQFATGFDYPRTLDPGVWFHLAMNYTAINRTLHTLVTRNGQPFDSSSVTLDASFTDFRLDHFAISSYSARGADGSILAHGLVDNISVTVPSLAVLDFHGALTNGRWSGSVKTLPGFVYELERSTNLVDWLTAEGPLAATGDALILRDNTPPPEGTFYRVKADLP